MSCRGVIATEHRHQKHIPSSKQESPLPFYDRLIAETEKERTAFTSIPLIREAIDSGASRPLYLDFLTQAYHHVKYTFPLLAFAAARTSDEAYQDALVEYMEEERGHEKWILNDIEAMGGDAVGVRNGKPGANQIPAELLRAVERPHGMRLEFSSGGIRGPVRVTISRKEYENQRDNREWVIQFPSDALRVL